MLADLGVEHEPPPRERPERVGRRAGRVRRRPAGEPGAGGDEPGWGEPPQLRPELVGRRHEGGPEEVCGCGIRSRLRPDLGGRVAGRPDQPERFGGPVGSLRDRRRPAREHLARGVLGAGGVGRPGQPAGARAGRSRDPVDPRPAPPEVAGEPMRAVTTTAGWEPEGPPGETADTSTERHGGPSEKWVRPPHPRAPETRHQQDRNRRSAPTLGSGPGASRAKPPSTLVALQASMP